MQLSTKGTVLSGYEGVRTAFEENLASGMESGAAFAVYRNGLAVVDLWGGISATREPGAIVEDSLFSIFSATKGMAAICIAMLVERGLLSYEAEVAAYWLEFAANDKADITVGELMSHQAGLVGTRSSATIEDYYEHDRIASELASQQPYFAPGQWGYHALTFGVLSDELVRRTDGRTMRQFFSEEVAMPHALDIHLGLPAEEDCRHVGICGSPDPSMQVFDCPDPEARAAALANPVIDVDWPNQREFRAHGIPGAGGSANARALAKLYAMLVCKQQPALLGSETLREATKERVCGIGQNTGSLGRYAAGFQLNIGAYGSNPGSFGHPGLGGSVAFADPARALGVAYTSNRICMSSWFPCDPRLAKLLEALYAAEAAVRS